MFIGLDLGTSGVKALLIDESQRIVDSAQAALDVSRPADGWSEQDPADWISATSSALTELGSRRDLSNVHGIGLSGQMHGATLLDKNGKVLRPCILWNDTRSHLEAAEMDSDPQFREITGNIVFPGFTAPKLAWVRKNEPEIFEAVATVLLPKDYLRYWLTGEYVSEMSDAAGTAWLDTGKRAWSDPLLKATGLSRDIMPALVEGAESSGELRTEIANEFGLPSGVPVAGGAGDNAASAIGVGVVRKGEAFISLGTSGVLFAASDGYAASPETALHTFCHALSGRWHQMGVILAAADALEWYGKLVGATATELTKGLEHLQAPGRPLFLPYLGGERTPHNDATIRAGFFGLEHATDRDAGTRAILEGVSFAFRDSLEAMSGIGTAPTQLIAVGGGSRSNYWLQALATALNLPIAVPEDGDFGAAFGAARLGMMAAGYGGDEIATPPTIDRIVEPVSGLTSAFSDAYARYTGAYHTLRELS